jgi:hypothetical protein
MLGLCRVVLLIASVAIGTVAAGATPAAGSKRCGKFSPEGLAAGGSKRIKHALRSKSGDRDRSKQAEAQRQASSALVEAQLDLAVRSVST